MYGMGAFNWIDLKGHHRNHRMERHPHLYHSSHTDYPDHHNSPQTIFFIKNQKAKQNL